MGGGVAGGGRYVRRMMTQPGFDLLGLVIWVGVIIYGVLAWVVGKFRGK